MGQPLRNTVWTFFNKLKIELLCDPAILLLNIYAKKTKSLTKMLYALPISMQHYLQSPRHMEMIYVSTNHERTKYILIYKMGYYVFIYEVRK